MSFVRFPAISSVVVCNSNNDVGGEKCCTGGAIVSAMFSTVLAKQLKRQHTLGEIGYLSSFGDTKETPFIQNFYAGGPTMVDISAKVF